MSQDNFSVGKKSFAAQVSTAARSFANLQAWNYRAVRWGTFVLGSALFFMVATVPLDLNQQVAFAVASVLVAMLLNKMPGRLATLAMVVFSVSASVRYIYWRCTETLGFETPLDQFFGGGLLLAELYALLVLLLGYFQTAWPLERKPQPMPPDSATWPTVDVFIPTYNEPLEVVKQTVFTAMGMDWPASRFKIYVLDDGRRDVFRDFCADVGIGYLTRDNNHHAKAGNINAALKVTDSEYVAIFDCDHIPTRSFLQICTGWFLKDSKLAMLQTPHFFFSPDPFEKNLDTFRAIPNEGELFYGLVQDGNDLWNATFFCGSCALIRRAPLQEVGGIAVETVTEDAHTALKLNRLGYNTAYLAIPQAAGLATESLSGHIGQRIRWARGMAQICRLDNPLLGPGLKLGQRLCYLNAMVHFFYGLPRLVFMTAPLAYLFLGAHVFQASALTIGAFALPHLVHANMTNSRMQGRFRHSFWNEVYESVLAWYIMRPVMVAFVNPKAGKFNVTAKGGVISEAYFDWSIAKPYVILLLLNLAGVAAGIWTLVFGDGSEITTVLINLLWTTYNLAITSASIAVASETRQVRKTPRVMATLNVALAFDTGRTLACVSEDFSQTGLGLLVPPDLVVPIGSQVHVSIIRADDEATFPATVVFRHRERLGIQFNDLTVPQQVELAQMTFARADLWSRTWGHGARDTPLRALRGILGIGAKGFGMLFVQSYAMVKAPRYARRKATKLDTGD